MFFGPSSLFDTLHNRNEPDLGTNFIPHEILSEKFDARLTNKDQSILASIPFRTPVLQRLKNSHLLFPTYSCSLRQLLQLPGTPTELLLSNGTALPVELEQRLLAERVDCGWHLLRRRPNRYGARGGYHEQVTGLPGGNFVPTLATVIFAIKLISVQNGAAGRTLFRGPDAMWTATTDGGGQQVSVLPYTQGSSSVLIRCRFPNDTHHVAIGSEVTRQPRSKE